MLYVCSQGAEISQGGVAARPSMPVPVRTRRKGERLFPASAPVRWDLGVRIGAALRAAQFTCGSSAGTGTRATVLPHFRRAHWHTMLSGPRKGVPADVRAREVRWMPPVAVNVCDHEETASRHPASALAPSVNPRISRRLAETVSHVALPETRDGRTGPDGWRTEAQSRLGEVHLSSGFAQHARCAAASINRSTRRCRARGPGLLG
jgi:hypothetical protein